MLKFLNFRLLFIMSIVLISIPQNGISVASAGRELISSELLEHANLKVLWDYQLPVRKGEKLKHLLIFGNNIYSIIGRDYVVSLNRENGNRIFSRNIALDGLPVEKLQLYNNILMSVGGSRIVEVDPKSGIKLKTIDMGFAIVGNAARNDMYYYLGGIDKRLHAVRVSDKVHMFEASADNESKVTAILADELDGEPFVIFTTDEGNIICMAPDQPKRRWQFNAAGAVIGSPVKDGRSLYFVCEDMNVYRLDMVGSPQRVRLVWKYQINGMPDQPPNLTREVVYQHVQSKGLTVIDKGGSFMWTVQGGIGLLAESDRKAYVLTRDSKLVVMDNSSRKNFYSINFTGVTNHATNVVDDKIYIAFENGRIACLQPIQ